MATECIITFRNLATIKIMNKSEGAEMVTVIHNRNVSLRIPRTLQDIMIAFNENDWKRSEILPPFEEHVQFPVRFAVKEITNYNDGSRVKKLDQLHEPLQVFLVNRLRYSDTGLSKMSGLAEMKIGQDQCTLLLPENATVCG